MYTKHMSSNSAGQQKER